MLIYSLLEKVRKGETITIEGSPGLSVNPIYIGDAVRVFDSALHQSVSGVFNVAGDEVVTIQDIVGIIEEVLEKKASIRHAKHHRSNNLVGENTRMKEVLNVFPETPLRAGLRKIL